MGELDDKVAVITGAGSGMAKARSRCSSVRAPRWWPPTSAAPKQDTAAEVGGDVLPVHCDVSKEADVEALMAAAVEEFGRVDAVLNVAGIADGCTLADLTMELYDRLMDVDLRGVMLGMKHGIRTMLPTGGGSIINWSSVGGLNGSAYTSVYQAAKHGIIGASKSAAIEYGTQGIRVNIICPGFILTEIMAVGGRGLHSRHRREGRPQPGRTSPTRLPRSAPFWPPTGPRSSPVRSSRSMEAGRRSWRSRMERP